MHAQGVCHCDVKYENCLVAGDGAVKLAPSERRVIRAAGGDRRAATKAEKISPPELCATPHVHPEAAQGLARATHPTAVGGAV